MRFRLKAFALHLTASACVLAVALGALYFGWYRWPGWYLTGMFHLAAILASVDVTLGPLITLLIANPRKPRQELARDISIIAAVQLIALGYGVNTLWQGRPLYYTFSGNLLETVQASAITPDEARLGRQTNPDLAPHWYSAPKWVWVPLTDDAKAAEAEAKKTSPDADITRLPRFFRHWSEGLPELRTKLARVDELFQYTPEEKRTLKRRMSEKGLSGDQPVAMMLTGAHLPLLAVFDPKTARMQALLRAD